MHINKNVHGSCATMREVAIVHVCFAPTICCVCKYDHCGINYCACCTFVAPLLCTIKVLCMQDYCNLHKHYILHRYCAFDATVVHCAFAPTLLFVKEHLASPRSAYYNHVFSKKGEKTHFDIGPVEKNM